MDAMQQARRNKPLALGVTLGLGEAGDGRWLLCGGGYDRCNVTGAA